MIKLYNTLSRSKEEFRALEKNKVRMYVCGPTVYDVPHIGHVRSAYVFDVIRKYLEYAGFEVLFVRNVTDIDDKIINKASLEIEEMKGAPREGLLKEKVKEVSARYLEVYHKELDEFGIKKPTVEPKATESIDEMIKFISILIEKGFAYQAGGNVYFSVEAFPGYGKLSGRDPEELLHGVRIDVDENKREPLDFALWKEAKPLEPFWESPWGRGRPGWHIECSVMSTGILGPEFDIHGGGLDLVFPHHENEIAQAEAATGKTFANYWIHNGLLTVSGEKMSKSLGNYITISDYLEKYTDPDLLKISFLSSHYRSPMDYSDEKMTESGKAKERIMIFLDKAERLLAESAPDQGKLPELGRTLKEKFTAAMDDDFNTPLAFAAIFEAVKKGNDALLAGDIPKLEKAGIIKTIKEHVLEAAGILGLSLKAEKLTGGAEKEIEKLVAKREEARKNKDYAESDRLRQELTDKGIVLEDTPEGPVWRKS